MKRGEIRYADLSPTVGAQGNERPNKRRPVLIVSNDANNRGASTVTVLPITSNLTRVYPFEVALLRGYLGGIGSAEVSRAIARYPISVR